MTTIIVPDWFLYLITFWICIEVLDSILKGVFWFLQRRLKKQIAELTNDAKR